MGYSTRPLGLCILPFSGYRLPEIFCCSLPSSFLQHRPLHCLHPCCSLGLSISLIGHNRRFSLAFFLFSSATALPAALLVSTGHSRHLPPASSQPFTSQIRPFLQPRNLLLSVPLLVITGFLPNHIHSRGTLGLFSLFSTFEM
jgi:hypothetical protein